MTDIVERLRRVPRWADEYRCHVITREAADEIEQLRFQNKNLIDMNQQAVARNVEWAAKWNQACGERDATAAEIERLRALLRAIMDDTSDGQESMSDDIGDRIERALEPKP